MKIFIIIGIIIACATQTRAQTVDTTANTNRIVFIFTGQEQRIYKAVHGDNWKTTFIDGSERMKQFTYSSEMLELATTRIKQDSLAYFRRQIERIREEIKK